MLPRPRFRLPLWSALTIAAAAYAVRSVSRGFDFTPDLPVDAIVLVVLLVVVGLVAYTRAEESRDAADEQPAVEADTDGPHKPERDEGPTP